MNLDYNNNNEIKNIEYLVKSINTLNEISKVKL